jgi:hypothetical protein
LEESTMGAGVLSALCSAVFTRHETPCAGYLDHPFTKSVVSA